MTTNTKTTNANGISESDSQVDTSKSVEPSEEELALEYWTKERMESAQPLPLPKLSECPHDKEAERHESFTRPEDKHRKEN